MTSEPSTPTEKSSSTDTPSLPSSVSQDSSPQTNSLASPAPVLEPDLSNLGDMPLLTLLDTKLDLLTGEQALRFITELRSLRTNPAAMKALRVKEGSALEGKRKVSKEVISQAKVEAANEDMFSKLGLEL